MAACFLLLVLLLTLVHSYGNLPDFTAIKGSKAMQRSSEKMIIAGNETTGKIYLIGGDSNPQQLITFDANINEFNDGGTNWSPLEINSYGQSYTTLNNKLWSLDKNGRNILTVDLSDSLTKTMTNIEVPDGGVGSKACLAANDDYLFVTCTSSADGKTYIYDLNRSEWLNVYPFVASDSTGYMSKRYGCGCVIMNNWLYTLGGAYMASDPDYGTWESTSNLIGKLDISGDLNATISSRMWQGRGASRLPSDVAGARAVAYGQWIFLVGGYKNARLSKYQFLKQVWYTKETMLPYMQIVDTANKDTAIGQWNVLNYPVKYYAPIIFDRKLYIFGGNDGSNTLNTYQYIELMPTLAPTQAPTEIPTSSPSVEPTVEPTMEPTPSPTDRPSSAPTAWLNDARNVAKVNGVSVGVVLLLVLCIIAAFFLGRRATPKVTTEYGLMNNDIGDEEDGHNAYQAL